MTLIVNHWPDPRFVKRGGVDGVCTINSAGKFWVISDIPSGRYRFVFESENLSNIAVSKLSGRQYVWILKEDLTKPRQTVEVQTEETGVAMNIFGNDDGTSKLSKLMVIDADQWEPLKTLMGEEIPYFDNRTMPRA